MPSGPDPNRDPPADLEATTSDGMGDAPRAGGGAVRWLIVLVLVILVAGFAAVAWPR
jgi:hypothetical protein